MKYNAINVETDPLIRGNSEYNHGLSSFLDAARWVSAFFVILTHLNNRMFVVLDKIPSPDRTIESYLWGFVCGFAHWGVVVFFVLSGFLVGGPVLKKALNGQKFNTKKYLVARITRIYLVLIPVLVVGSSLDYLGMGLFSASGVYSEHLEKLNSQSESAFIFSIVGSLLNLQNLFCDILGTNGPLETLANEFWYYMTFPLILAPILYHRSLKTWFLFGVGLCLIISMSLASKWHFVGFVLWSIGAVFSVKRERSFVNSPFVEFCIFIAMLILIRLVVRSSVIFGPYGFLFEIIIAILFANVLCSLQYNKVNWSLLNWAGHGKLGGFSYSLYAIHVPLLMFMCAALKSNFGYGWHDIPRYYHQWLTALLFLVICVVIAWTLSLLTERHTYRVRAFFNRRIGL
ncbi:hypothetical protein [Methylomonas albis]|uniref:Acyltransferase n=1 Tax=Methylomonas albis TaxID=1854563 RepID=A0ABR9D5R1_9GAMM|nr:acyltransferase [Methylomonas albis]MBD9358413.1 acyltransferase [Methylomonas albis]CAD6881815.1 hypothetical protein [Methylomonas albis]